MSVIKLPSKGSRLQSFDGGGGSGDDGGMEARLATLERHVKDLPTRADLEKAVRDLKDETTVKLHALDKQVATGFEAVEKSLQKGQNDLIKWIVGIAFVGMAAAITVGTFVLNNASPKSPPSQQVQPAPIVIQVPYPVVGAPVVPAAAQAPLAASK